jgi:hypothetical protein
LLPLSRLSKFEADLGGFSIWRLWPSAHGTLQSIASPLSLSKTLTFVNPVEVSTLHWWLQ